MIPPFAHLILLISLIVLSSTFNNNCAQYEPTNFDNCLSCATGYYLENGKCLECPKKTNNISLCQPSLIKPSPVNNSNSTPSSTSNPPLTLTSPNPPLQNSDISSNTSLNQMLLLKNFLPDHCNGFAFTSLGITCNACEQGFILTPPNSCTPLTTTNNPINLNKPIFPSFTSTNTQQQGSFSTAASSNYPQALTTNQTVPNTANSNQTSQTSTYSQQQSTNNHQNKQTSSLTDPTPTIVQSVQNSSNSQATTNSQSSVKTVSISQNIPILIQSQTNSQKSSSQTTSHNTSFNTIYQEPPKTQTVSSTIPNYMIYQKSDSSSSSSSSSSSNNSSIVTQFTTSAPIPPITFVTPQPFLIAPPSPTTFPKDNNCAIINPTFSILLPFTPNNPRCSQCYNGFFLNLTSQLCQQKNPLCKETDWQGLCLTCYIGYTLTNGQCAIGSPQKILTVPQPQKLTTTSTTPSQDPNCQQYQPITFLCITCGKRYYLDSTTSRCTAVDSSCQTWNSTTGRCLNCYTGYTIDTTNPKVCIALSQTITTSSPITNTNLLKANCNNYRLNICTSCIPRFYLLNGMCFPVNDLCKTYNVSFGFCTSCYEGYTLSEGSCQKSVTPSTIDPYCVAADSNGICQRCISSYYPDNDGICQPVSLLCYQYNPLNGNCTACYVYYILKDGQCIYYQNI